MPSPIQYERLIIGYHGCDRSVGEAVLLGKEQHLKLSDNPYDWLGTGVYFWEHGPERAIDWARGMKKRGKLDEPYVIGAFIHLGRCLDLTDIMATQALSRWYRDLSAALGDAGEPMPVNKGLAPNDEDLILRFLDCAVINFGVDELAKADDGIIYQTVRGVFQEGDPAFDGSGIKMKTHVQVAVRDIDCILGYFRPSE